MLGDPDRLRRWLVRLVAASAVAGGLALAVGSTSDLGVLVRGGAMVRGLIEGGEWWRLVTCIFVHVGTVHLAVNAIGMVFLGRVTEELFGTARTLALFAVCGLAGSVASFLASPAGVSAGASGAIFGLLGAVFIELTWQRQKYRMAWKRGMWGGLVVVTVAQVGVGFLYPVIDQWAHGAGLLAGVMFGFVLSPSARWATAGRSAAIVLAIGFAALSITAAVLVARTPIAASLASAPAPRHTIGGIAITAPGTWSSDGELVDPDGMVFVTVQRAPLQSIAPQMVAWIAQAHAIGKARGFDEVAVATDRVIAMSEGWEGTELIGSYEDPMGVRQSYRVVVAGRAFGATLVQVIVMTPESIARGAPAFFAKLLTSVGPAPATP